MKSNVLETKINIGKVDGLIAKYECAKGVPPSYIVMNKWTLNEIVFYMTLRFKNGENMFPAYNGIPIAICEKLKDGEVEVV